MDLFEWNDSYSVNVGLCDAQHKRLFEIINQLANAMRMGKGKAVIQKTLADLVAYTQVHFQDEEALMQRAKYPEYAGHQQSHQRFVAEVNSYFRESKEGHSVNTVELLNLVQDWLVNHIQKTDKAYSAYLNAAGIQ